MPPEPIELWARRCEIKEELSDWQAPALSGSLLPGGCLDDRVQLPVFPGVVRYFGWEGAPGAA